MLSQAQIEELTATVRRAVFSVCHRWDEDLAQDVWVTILPLVDRYDMARGVPLAGWLYPRARGAVIDALRMDTGFRRLHRPQMLSLSTPRSRAIAGHRREPGRTRQWEIDEATSIEAGTEVEDRDELARAMRRMSPRGRAVLVARVGGEKAVSIAARLGVSPARVSQIVNEAKRAGMAGGRQAWPTS